MRDPFAQKSNSSALRDAQIGLLLVATLLGVFVYVAFYRITGQGRILPEHVRMAPVATAVWPNGPPEHPTHETQSVSMPNTASQTIVATVQPSPRQATNPAQNFEPKAKPIRKPIVTAAASPQPLRTDRYVAPVDFQSAASKAKPKPTPFTVKTLPPKPSLKTIKKPDAARATVAPEKIATNTFVSSTPKPAKLQPSSNDFQSTKSIFEQSNPKLGSLKPADLKIPETQITAIGNASHPITAADTNSLRSETTQPRTLIPAPAPRTEPARTEPAGTRNSFQPLLNSIKMPQPTFQPATKQPDFSPQQDIAKSAHVITKPATQPKLLPKRTTANPQTAFRAPVTDKTTSPLKTSGPDRNFYTSQAGDSFWSIATEQYGDGRFFDALYRWNQTKVTAFDDLPAATELEIPSITELAQRWPDLCPNDKAASQSTTFNDQAVANYDTTLTERLYTTRKGDTLFEIAAKKLGQASRYVDIMAKNDQRLPADVNHSVPLRAGLRLVLPD